MNALKLLMNLSLQKTYLTRFFITKPRHPSPLKNTDLVEKKLNGKPKPLRSWPDCGKLTSMYDSFGAVYRSDADGKQLDVNTLDCKMLVSSRATQKLSRPEVLSFFDLPWKRSVSLVSTQITCVQPFNESTKEQGCQFEFFDARFLNSGFFQRTWLYLIKTRLFLALKGLGSGKTLSELRVHHRSLLMRVMTSAGAAQLWPPKMLTGAP